MHSVNAINQTKWIAPTSMVTNFQCEPVNTMLIIDTNSEGTFSMFQNVHVTLSFLSKIFKLDVPTNWCPIGFDIIILALK